MAEFFDHPETGKLHFRSVAGGTGGGATSVYEAPATKADMAAHPGAHARYLIAKRQAAEKANAAAVKAAETKAEVAQIEASAKALAETQTE
jgi:hypothetical protein